MQFEIGRQPNNSTCGPTCLQAVYRYFGDDLPLQQIITETAALETGGTLAVYLGCHARKRGYDATIYTYNLQVFDPTWFRPGAPPLPERLQAQMAAKDDPRLLTASRAYLEFLERGGAIRMETMTAHLIRKYLKKQVPILTGLSATYLYNERREYGPQSVPDDVHGKPQGHFVVLCGYDSHERTVLVADPLHPNPLAHNEQKYVIDMERAMCAIMLGIVTFDANLLIIQSRPGRGPVFPP